MLSEILENNIPILNNANSYLIPRLNHIISLLQQLERDAGTDFSKIICKSYYTKGTYLIREGSRSKNIWVLETGIARLFSRKEHSESTRYFFVPGEFADSYHSSGLNIPSSANIQLLTNSAVIAINRCHLESLKPIYPVIGIIESVIIACHASWLEWQMDRLKFSNARQKYTHLLETQPYLLQNVPLTYLASYLGISLETLSRIRAKRGCLSN